MILIEDILTLTIDDEFSIYHSRDRAEAFSQDGLMMIFDPDAIVGFEDSPEVKRDITGRPNSHGDFRSRGFYEGKVVSVSGTAIAPSPQELMALRHKFVGSLNDGNPHKVEITTSGQTLHMNMSQGSRVTWIKKLDNVAVWKVDLYSDDARMYGGIKTAQAYSETRDDQAIKYPITYPINYGNSEVETHAVLFNDGNEPAWPVYTVDAYLPSGFSIVNGGSSIEFSGPVFGGTPVVIDTFDGTATVEGRDRSYQLIRRDWSPIPPRGSLRVEFMPLDGQESAAFVDITYRDTWT